MQGGYAELHVVSNFSFQRGASPPDALVTRAQELGYAAVALTDEASLAGIVRAHVAAKDAGVKLLVGAEPRAQGEGGRGELHRVLPTCSLAGTGQVPAAGSESPKRAAVSPGGNYPDAGGYKHMSERDGTSA